MCVMGMFGGLFVNNDLVVCYLVVVLGLNVIVVIEWCNIVVDDFFFGMYEIVLVVDEFIIEV